MEKDVQKVKDIINENFEGSSTEFAKKNKASRQHVNFWKSKNFIVVDGDLYLFRRKLKIKK